MAKVFLSEAKAKELWKILSKMPEVEKLEGESSPEFYVCFHCSLCAPVIEGFRILRYQPNSKTHGNAWYLIADIAGTNYGAFQINTLSDNSLTWKFNPNFQKKKEADEKARTLFKKYTKAYTEYFSVNEELRVGIPFPADNPKSGRLFLENARRLADCVTRAKRDAKEHYFEQVAKENSDLQRQLKDKVDALLLDSYPEGGKKKAAQHLVRERNSKLIKAAKALYRHKNPKMPCEACGFSFVKKYGERGEDFIEGHHKIPISAMTEERKMKPSEIALVCANCHRMIHRAHPWLSVEELKKILQPCKG